MTNDHPSSEDGRDRERSRNRGFENRHHDRPGPTAVRIEDLYGEIYGGIDEPGGWSKRLERLARQLGFAAAWIERPGDPSPRSRRSLRDRCNEQTSIDLLDSARFVFAFSFDDAPDHERLEEIRGHLVRAWSLSACLRRRRLESASLGALVECLATPLVIVDREGRVCRVNAAAHEILSETPGLSPEVDSGLCRDPSCRRLVQSALEVAARPEVRRLGRVHLPRPASPPLEIIVSRLDRAGTGADDLYVVLLVDPEGGNPTPASVLASTYDLTDREADLVAQILDGCGLVEAGERLGVSHETARSHLKSVFAKLGTTRQIDLVRMVMLGAGSVRT